MMKFLSKRNENSGFRLITYNILLLIFLMCNNSCTTVRPPSDDTPPAYILAVLMPKAEGNGYETIFIKKDTTIKITKQSDFYIIASCYDEQGLDGFTFAIIPFPGQCPGTTIPLNLTQTSGTTGANQVGSIVHTRFVSVYHFNQTLINQLTEECPEVVISYYTVRGFVDNLVEMTTNSPHLKLEY